MLALSNKSKQYGFIALKVLLLSITFAYIYFKLTQNKAIPIADFLATLQTQPKLPLVIFVIFTFLNWIFEILKWKAAVSSIRKHSFKEAAVQCLTAFASSLLTPNRIAEYGVKAYFFEAIHRKKIVLLQLLSNMFQLLSTLLFGVIGLGIVIVTYPLPVAYDKVAIGIIVFIGLVLLGIKLQKKEWFIKGLSIYNIVSHFKRLPRLIKIKLFVFSIVRYLIFSTLFYLLLQYFGATISWDIAFPLITSMYLLSSIVPTIFIMDVAVKGGVALWLFSFASLSVWTVLCTVLSMWILNVVLPVLWGSYYVANVKKQW